MDKYVEHGWGLYLKIDLVHHIKDTVVVPLGVDYQLSTNEKWEH